MKLEAIDATVQVLASSTVVFHGDFLSRSFVEMRLADVLDAWQVRMHIELANTVFHHRAMPHTAFAVPAAKIRFAAPSMLRWHLLHTDHH